MSEKLILHECKRIDWKQKAKGPRGKTREARTPIGVRENKKNKLGQSCAKLKLSWDLLSLPSLY